MILYFLYKTINKLYFTFLESCMYMVDYER